jgi:hypothetical protein
MDLTPDQSLEVFREFLKRQLDLMGIDPNKLGSWSFDFKSQKFTVKLTSGEEVLVEVSKLRHDVKFMENSQEVTEKYFK